MTQRYSHLSSSTCRLLLPPADWWRLPTATAACSWLLPTAAASCPWLLLPAAGFSEFVFVIVIVKIFFLNDVQFYWIESYYFQLHSAFLAGNTFTLISIRIHMDVGFTLGTCSSRHFSTSREFERQ
jgi:hypothetical protein